MSDQVRSLWPLKMIRGVGFAALLCTLLLVSCEEQHQQAIYVAAREWTFVVKNSQKPSVDTLVLTVCDDNWHLFQRKIRWSMREYHTKRLSAHSELTGVLDNSISFFFPNEIWIHPPRMSYLRLAELIAFPQVIFPIIDSQFYLSEIKPSKGWKELQGLTVHGRTKVTGKVLFQYPALRDSCWKLEASGSSEHGEYSAIYYYNPTLGFVYFHYDFHDYVCDIELISHNF